jgi:hypothetical protein
LLQSDVLPQVTLVPLLHVPVVTQENCWPPPPPLRTQHTSGGTVQMRGWPLTLPHWIFLGVKTPPELDVELVVPLELEELVPDVPEVPEVPELDALLVELLVDGSPLDEGGVSPS